jgi:hypothetical protein
MQNEYIVSDPIYMISDTTDKNTVSSDDLTEIYCTIYRVKNRIPGEEPTEMYAFTTKFDQAFKRFKLLPHKSCTLIRILTDREDMIKLAIDGTKRTYTDDDLDDETKEYISQVKFSDIYGGVVNVRNIIAQRLVIEEENTDSKQKID